MIRRLFFLSVLLTAFCLTSAAQIITGTVIDQETGEGIPYASVVYKGHNVAVVSDENGHYRIDRHNGWSITYSAVGYKTQVVEFVSPEATARNILLRCEQGVKPGQVGPVGEYLGLRDYWRVTPWLETRLARLLGPHLARLTGDTATAPARGGGEVAE